MTLFELIVVAFLAGGGVVAFLAFAGWAYHQGLDTGEDRGYFLGYDEGYEDALNSGDAFHPFCHDEPKVAAGG